MARYAFRFFSGTASTNPSTYLICCPRSGFKLTRATHAFSANSDSRSAFTYTSRMSHSCVQGKLGLRGTMRARLFDVYHPRNAKAIDAHAEACGPEGRLIRHLDLSVF